MTARRFTEAQMAGAFEKLLRNPAEHGYRYVFDLVYKEVPCWPGRPDFLGLKGGLPPHSRHSQLPLSLIACSILSVLKPRAGRTESHIQLCLGTHSQAVRRVLSQLGASGFVVRTGKTAYRLGPSAIFVNLKLTTFELKLSSPARAVYQAVRNKEFSDRSYIVVPPGMEPGYSNHLPSMNRWGIGLLTFDPHTAQLNTVLCSRVVSPPSRAQAIRSKSKIAHSALISAAQTSVLCLSKT